MNGISIADMTMIIITTVYTIATVFICIANFLSVKASKDAIEETKKEFEKSRELENEIRQQKQAVKVACWQTSEDCDSQIFEREDCDFVSVHISNSSSEPVYEVVLSQDIIDHDMTTVMQTGSRCCIYLQCVPPGDYITVLPWGGPGMHMQFSPSISFRDAAGMNWHRDANGILTKIQVSTVEFRKLDLPVEYGDYTVSNAAIMSGK